MVTETRAETRTAVERARATASCLLLSLPLTLAGACTRGAPPDTDTRAASPTAAAAASEQGSTKTNEKAAQAAAEAWLALVDAANYPQSWVEAAAAFKKVIDQPGWEKAVDAARSPLGKMLSRTLKSARYATSVPGAPDGEYVVIQFNASFENKKAAIETVTPMKESDGRWRVSGYFIK